MRRTWLVVVWISAAALAVVSCAPEEEDFSLLQDEDDRLRRRRARMNVRVLDSGGNEVERTPNEFVGDIAADCQSAALNLTGATDCRLPEGGMPALDQTCLQAACSSTASLCIANRYLELGAAIEPIEVGGWTVPPQSNATKAGFYERAAYFQRSALTISGEALRAAYLSVAAIPGTAPATTHCLPGDLYGTLIPSSDPSMEVAELLVGNLGEAASLTDEATAGAVRRNIAHADAEPSRTTDLALATRAGWHDPFLSRARAGQLLWGSVFEGSQTLSYGLPDSCALPPLTARGRQALEYIRSSGVSPAHVQYDQSIVYFLHTGDLSAEGVVNRIAAMQGTTYHACPPGTLCEYDPSPNTFVIDSFLTDHHLSRADFVEARAYLRCELDAFPRDPNRSETDPGGSGYELYHAVRFPPVNSRWPQLLMDVLVRESDPYYWPSGDLLPWRHDLALRGSVHALDYARRVSATLVSAESGTSPAGLLQSGQTDFLGLVAAQTSLRTSGRVTSCGKDAGDGVGQNVRVILDDDGERLRSAYAIVQEGDSLECALYGNVDGTECSLSSTDFRAISFPSAGSTEGTGYARRLTFTYDAPAASSGVRDYLVLRQDGLQGRPPGGYDLVAPIFTPPTGDMTGLGAGDQLCDEVPATPPPSTPTTTTDDVPDDPLSPDPQQTTSPDAPCHDLGDIRQPLEAELSDDGDRYESSHRRMLAVALEAAQQADALGEQHVAQGLEIDARAESAQRELERLCGASVDLSTLFDTNLSDVRAGACTSGGCPLGYECMGSACILNVARRISQVYADDTRSARILRDCLGEAATVVPIVALGSTDLCVWRNSSDPSLLCEPGGVTGPADAPHPCPYRDNGGCALRADYTLSSGYSIRSVRDKLGFFDEGHLETHTGGNTPDASYECGPAIRYLRSGFNGSLYDTP